MNIVQYQYLQDVILEKMGIKASDDMNSNDCLIRKALAERSIDFGNNPTNDLIDGNHLLSAAVELKIDADGIIAQWDGWAEDESVNEEGAEESEISGEGE